MSGSDYAMCEYCKGVTIASISIGEGYKHRPLEDFETAVDDCAGCRALVKWTPNESYDLYPQTTEVSRYISGYSLLLRLRTTDRVGDSAVRVKRPRLQILFCKEEQDGSWTVKIEVPEGLRYEQGSMGFPRHGETYLDLFTDRADPAVGWDIHVKSMLPQSTASIGSLRTAASWLRQCHGSHRLCKDAGVISRTAIAPARLLRVQSKGRRLEVCLIDTADPLPPFAALSYCWGTAPAYWRTTLGNLTQKRNGFGIARLPLTLRQACQFVFNIGLNHIWIDALCIIQDDEQDWLREAEKMHEVYALAYVTIAAAASRSSHEGLFNEQSVDHTDLMTSCAPFSSLLPDRQRSVLYVCDTYPRGVMNARHDAEAQLWNTEILNGPWNQRAWTCQERIFAARMLYFSDSQLFWECRTTRKSEDRLLVEREIDGGMWEEVLRLFKRSLIDDSKLSEVWDLGLIPAYSARKLTSGRDKLIAISSLAQAMHRRSPHVRYLAGLWHDDLVRSLCWTVVCSLDLVESVASYQAPTWSWASQNSAVSYAWGPVRDAAGTSSSHNVKCEICRVSIALLNEGHPFGAVIGGELQLCAMVLSLTRLTYTSDYATSVEGSDRLIYVETRFDTGTRPQICSAILLIQEHDRCYFLLVETMDTGKAKRIGLACFPGFFELARTLRDPFVPLDAFSAIEGNKAIMTIV